MEGGRKLEPLGSPSENKKTTFCAKQMKDICIYSSDGRADLTQAGEIKSFLKDILYNFTLKRRRPSPNILKPGCLLSRLGKW